MRSPRHAFPTYVQWDGLCPAYNRYINSNSTQRMPDDLMLWASRNVLAPSVSLMAEASHTIYRTLHYVRVHLRSLLWILLLLIELLINQRCVAYKFACVPSPEDLQWDQSTQLN